MTKVTKEKLEELINQVKNVNYEPPIFIITKEMNERFREYISHLGNVKIIIQELEETERE
jgi:uncharacterized protein involved in tolerance to divalent cations